MDKVEQGSKTQGEKSQGTKAQGEKPAKAPKAAKLPKEPKEKKVKPVRETPAHMPKVDKVASSLPPLSDDASVLFAGASNLSSADIVNLVAHLTITVRRRGVASA